MTQRVRVKSSQFVSKPRRGDSGASHQRVVTDNAKPMRYSANMSGHKTPEIGKSLPMARIVNVDKNGLNFENLRFGNNLTGLFAERARSTSGMVLKSTAAYT